MSDQLKNSSDAPESLTDSGVLENPHFKRKTTRKKNDNVKGHSTRKSDEVLERRINKDGSELDEFLTPRQAADYLQVSPKFIYERIERGEIKSQPMGNRLKRIRRSTLEMWLLSQKES